MCQTLSLFLLLHLFIDQACIGEHVTLCPADWKDNMRIQLEAIGTLDNLAYNIRWFGLPAVAPLVEALNAGAMDAGIVSDVLSLFALTAGARPKAVAVGKPDPYGTAALMRGDSPLHPANDLKGQRVTIGRSSIGHFVVLKTLASTGLGERDVEFRFLGPMDTKTAFANGSVGAWAAWELYTAFVKTADEARILVGGCGLWAGNNFLAATDNALANSAKHAVLQGYPQRLASAQRWAYLHPDKYL